MIRHPSHAPSKLGANVVAHAKHGAAAAVGKAQGAAGSALQSLPRGRPVSSLPGKIGRAPDLSELVQRADRSSLDGVQPYRNLREYLMAEHQRDGGASFLDDLEALARDERRKLEGLVRFGQDIAGSFRDPRRRQQLLNEVLLPGQRGQISGPAAVQRTNAIAGRTVLGNGDTRFQGWTTGVGISMGFGLGAGVGAVVGICGVRNLMPCVYRAASVGAGAIMDADLGVQVQFARCDPPDFGGLSLEYSVGGGHGATFSVGVAFAAAPFFTAPRIQDRWEFDSLAVQLGGGGGIDASVSLEYCQVRQLLAGPTA